MPPSVAAEFPQAPSPVSSGAASRLFIMRTLLVVLPIVGLMTGLLWPVFGNAAWQSWIWVGATLPVLCVLILEIGASLRHGEFGLDIVAAISMTAALLVGENLAAVVVAVMYSGGGYLEAFAERHARREMTALLSRVPRSALRHRDGNLEEVPLDLILPGDLLLIRQGDVVPVDGIVARGLAVLDQSALTGEALPVQQHAGESVMSGSANAGDAFDLTATQRAEQSTYAGIVRLVESAQRSKAPMSRLADRFALAFLVVTVGIAGATWVSTGEVIRAVAVLVVATPCPLILAVPVAIVSGLSRAARHGILVKGGKALETLATIRSIVLDKTGTLTDGRARVVTIDVIADLAADEVLRIAASLEQTSKHVIAATIVNEARARGLQLALPCDVMETAGEGVIGIVDARRVLVGGSRFVQAGLTESNTLPVRLVGLGSVIVDVAIDGRLVGKIVLADNLRAGSGALLSDLRKLGIQRVVLATGDRREVAEAVTSDLAIDAIKSGLAPDQKVQVVLAERKAGPVMMVGDGVNDAPALAAADVGVAMGARGTAASVEAADVVILVDQLDRLVPAIRIARRSRVIALESVVAGMGLSLIGMIAAACGYITPLQGALLQEGIDVAVILNALRALYDTDAIS